MSYDIRSTLYDFASLCETQWWYGWFNCRSFNATIVISIQSSSSYWFNHRHSRPSSPVDAIIVTVYFCECILICPRLSQPRDILQIFNMPVYGLSHLDLKCYNSKISHTEFRNLCSTQTIHFFTATARVIRWRFYVCRPMPQSISTISSHILPAVGQIGPTRPQIR